MQEYLYEEICKRITVDFGFKQAGERGQYFRKGKCPECGEKSLFTDVREPKTLKCGRENNCGAVIYVRERYPDLFESWSDRFKSTEKNPTAAADAYLSEARGFDLSRLRGHYSQEWHRDQDLGIVTATVRFRLPNGIWWERFIDRPERFGGQKAKFAPGKDTSGEWWELPAGAEWPSELWLVEGIFDAIALEHHGICARSIMSCNNYPDKALERLRAAAEAASKPLPSLVWALDADKAGQEYAVRWHKRAKEDGWKSSAALIPCKGRNKQDWNDAHLRGKLAPKDRELYRYEGALLVATTPSEKARLIYNHTGRSAFHFGHDNRLYWYSYNESAYNEAKDQLSKAGRDLSDDELRDEALARSATIKQLVPCYPEPLYFQANRLTDESWYYYRISFPNGRKAEKATFTAAQLASSAEFKKRLLSVASSAVYVGSTGQLDHINSVMMEGIKTVETISHIGYAAEHKCYVFGNVAVKDGVVYKRNDDDYFDIGKLSIKSLAESLKLSVNTKRDAYRDDWLEMVWRCYGVKGVVSLAFWLGSLFAEQIRSTQESYPFLEMSGEPGTGKSTLITFLWKLVGRTKHEGMDPAKSSLVGRTRTFTQVANLPVVLIESDRGKDDEQKQRKFDWEEIKPLFNGHIGRAIGLKNFGSDTYDPPFRASIVIEQNAPVMASKAVMERIVHMTFDKSLHSRENREFAQKLSAIDVAEVSHFILKSTQKEAEILRVIEDATREYTDQLLSMPDMKNVRLAQNHAQMMALVDALKLVAPLTADQLHATHAALIEMTFARQTALDVDHAHVQTFWELYDFVGGDSANGPLNHSSNENLIAVSLVEFEARVIRAGGRMPCDLADLKSHLRTSRARKFLDHKNVKSRLTGEAKKCWIFQRGL